MQPVAPGGTGGSLGTGGHGGTGTKARVLFALPVRMRIGAIQYRLCPSLRGGGNFTFITLLPHRHHRPQPSILRGRPRNLSQAAARNLRTSAWVEDTLERERERRCTADSGHDVPPGICWRPLEREVREGREDAAARRRRSRRAS